MLVDSHCHLDQLDLSSFGGDFEKFIDSIGSLDVGYMLCVSINWENFPGMMTLVQKYNHVGISLGVHPNETGGHDPSLEELIDLSNKSGVIAIGETGLDYYRSSGDLSWQQERFRRHIRAARALKVPIIVHSREAKVDTIRILREERADEVGGVLHCFTGDEEMMQQGIDLNFSISYSGIITFKNAKDLHAVARVTPLDKLMIETDSPYLAPHPLRGSSNHPGTLHHIAQAIAMLKGCDYTEIAQRTTENFFRVFSKAKC